MARSPKTKKKKPPKTVLKLPDLEQSKSAVLNSLASASSQRSYDLAIREFIEWYCSEHDWLSTKQSSLGIGSLWNRSITLLPPSTSDWPRSDGWPMKHLTVGF